MKVRILVYGLLIALICSLVTLYLVWTNQDRILQAARYKLVETAREKWGVALTAEGGRLDLARSAVVFDRVGLAWADEEILLRVSRLEMIYSLSRLLEGEVLFHRIRLEKPVLEVRKEAQPERRPFKPEDILAALSAAERVEVEDGSLHLAFPEGQGQLRADGVGLRIERGRGSVEIKAWLRSLAVQRDFLDLRSGEGFVQGALSPEGFTFRKLEISGEQVSLKAEGFLSPGWSLRADFEAGGDLARIGRWFKGGPPLTGSARADGSFELDGADWLAQGRVRSKGLSIYGEPLPDAGSSFRLGPGGCGFTDIAGVTPGGGRLTGRGELSWSPGRFGYDFEIVAAHVVPARVPYLGRHLPAELLEPGGPFGGRVGIAGVAGNKGGDRWAVSLDISGSVPRYFGERQVAIRGEVSPGEAGRSALREFSLTSGPLRASWAGTAGGPEGLSVAFMAETADLSATLEPLQLSWLGGQGSFVGDITGSGEELTVEGGLYLEPASFRGATFDGAQGRLRWRAGVFTADGLELRRGGGRAVVHGALDSRRGNLLEARAEIREMDVSMAAGLLGAQIQATGPASGSLFLQGRPESLSGGGRLSAARLAVGKWRLERAEADFTFDPNRASFSRLQADMMGGRVSYRGTWSREGEMAGDLEGTLPSLERAWPGRGLEGEVSWTAAVQGRWPKPDLRGSVRWRNLRWRGAPVPEAVLKVAKEGETIRATGSLPPGHDLELEVGLAEPWPARAGLSFRGLDLGTVFPLMEALGLKREVAFLRPYKAVIDGKLTLTLPLARPREATGRLRLTGLQLDLGGEVSRLSEPAEFSFAAGSIRIGRLVVEGGLHRLSLEGGLDGGRLDVSVNGSLDLGFLASRYPEHLRSIEMRPDISLNVSGTPGSPQLSGKGRVKGGRLGLKGLGREIEDISGTVEFDRQQVRVRDLELGYAGRPMRGSGWYSLADRRVGLSLKGGLGLASLGLALPGVREYDGEAQVELEVSGTASAPVFEADAVIDRGLLRLSGLQTPLRDVKASLALREEYVRIREFRASLNGGGLAASGYLVWTPGRALEDVDLDIRADKIYLAVPDTLKVVLSADLNLKGAPEDLLLKGRALIERGKYFRNMEPRPAIIALTREREAGLKEVVERYPFLARLSLDLGLTAQEGFWIDNNVAQINAGVDLTLRGTVREPVLSGSVSVQEGSIYYLGKKFRLIESSMTFHDRYPPDPQLNVQADTTVGDVSISLVIEGTLAALKLDLYSDPPYSREDIVSLLTLGATRSQLQNKGGEVSAMGAAMVFSGTVLNKVEDQARSFTGLEVFQIEPTMSDTGGAARLVIGKRVSERIFVSYARNLATTGDEQFSMEYQVLDFVSLVGREDRQGIYSFDLVFSFGGR